MKTAFQTDTGRVTTPESSDSKNQLFIQLTKQQEQKKNNTNSEDESAYIMTLLKKNSFFRALSCPGGRRSRQSGEK